MKALVIIAFILTSSNAFAGDFSKWGCKEVRAAVMVVGEAEAERIARASGAGDDFIERARRCIAKKRPGASTPSH